VRRYSSVAFLDYIFKLVFDPCATADHPYFAAFYVHQGFWNTVWPLGIASLHLPASGSGRLVLELDAIDAESRGFCEVEKRVYELFLEITKRFKENS
jgi:hypothetical protein